MAFYGLAHARRGLIFFAAGKLASALLGMALLVLMVRRLEAAAYGAYVAALALAELFYLVTGLGLSTVAQRYVAEFRLRAPADEFTRFLRQQFLRRMAHSLVGCLLVVLAWPWVMAWTSLALPLSQAPLLALLLAGWAASSFLDEVLGATLLQGLAQLLALLRNLARLTAVLVLSMQGDLTLITLLWAEAGIVSVSSLAGSLRVLHWARVSPSADGATAGFRPSDMDAVCRRFYTVQLLGQAYGVNVIKLLLTRLQGVAQTAAFGVAQSIADMLRNYMPAQLLAGWIRPLMVARYVAHRDIDQLCLVANLAFKANLFGLLPLLVLFATLGDELVSGLSAGRYPQLGPLLAVLALGLILQSAHLLMTMVTLTIEASAANIRATLLSALTLPLLAWLVYQHGSHGAAWAGVVAEIVWVGSAFWWLRGHGHRLWLDMRGTVRLLAAGLASAMATVLAKTWALPLPAAVAVLGITFLATVAVLDPSNPAERQLLSRFVGRRNASA